MFAVLKMKIRSTLESRRDKGWHELNYWQGRQQAEGTLKNSHYLPLYTTMFQVDRSFYASRRVLDIGCGPRGSLEWATETAERVGLDPLVEQYRTLGIARHAMTYVAAPAEHIPFGDGHFDIVTSLNSLDHVDDPKAAMVEIARVLKPGGSFLLEVEIGHDPTPMEPISFWFDILDDLASNFQVLDERRYEMPADGSHLVHDAWLCGGSFDMSQARHAGVLVAHLERRP